MPRRKINIGKCAVQACLNDAKVRGMCWGHDKMLRRGDILRPLRKNAPRQATGVQLEPDVRDLLEARAKRLRIAPSRLAGDLLAGVLRQTG